MSKEQETAVFAAGCFWGVEEIFRQIPGVLDTECGYCGGALGDPGYYDVMRGDTGHAESVLVVFDPSVVAYEELVRVFFRLHDPTTKDRQGNDRGHQYRSAIFVEDDAQREAAERVKAEVDASGKWPAPVVTEIADGAKFWAAEPDHQDYLQKHPHGYSCHFLRD